RNLHSSRSAERRGRTAALAASIALLVLAVATVAMPAAASKGKGKAHRAGFKTSQAAMLDAAVPGASVTPLITVGETLPGSSYMFDTLPDGISLRKGKGHTVQAYVNHETSAVPFPFNPATGVGVTNFTNALVSKLTLVRQSAGTVAGSFGFSGERNYHPFCSKFLV